MNLTEQEEVDLWQMWALAKRVLRSPDLSEAAAKYWWRVAQFAAERLR